MASKKELALKLERVSKLFNLGLPECKFYNTAWRGGTSRAGSEAGNLRSDGYRRIKIDGSLFLAHRLVWFALYKVWPDGVIDHINGNTSDNRIENLRDVPRRVNMQNSAKYRREDRHLPTGVVAVKWKGNIVAYRAKWTDINGKQHHSPCFNIKKLNSEKAATNAAHLYRLERLEELNTQGANYTNRHGLPHQPTTSHLT